MKAIKLKELPKEKALLIHFIAKCIQKGYFLPYSYIKLIILVYKHPHWHTDRLITKALKLQILTHEQAARNYLSKLAKWGITEKTTVGHRRLSKFFTP
jgi:hypothetical protein